MYQFIGQDRRLIVFGLSCLCGLNCVGLPAFIYFGEVTKGCDAFGPLFLCPSNVTPVFHHESTPHLLLETNSVYIIHFVLVGDWFVQQSANKPQTQWERDLMQMWAAISLGEHCVTWQKIAAKETFRPLFCCFLLTHLTFPDVIQILRNVFIKRKDSVFKHPVCLL